MTARLVRAGLLCGIVDGLWAVALTTAYGRPAFSGAWATLPGLATDERERSLLEARAASLP